ncbi:MAG TPA: MBOAT family protein, partial [Crocinitomicaceae bacterium]|nr:MBOAT family protein [Crocinitomicaceae bacterium]
MNDFFDLFSGQRFHDLFLSWKNVDLTFSKLDFWLFFLAVMLIFSVLHKNKVVRSIYLTAVSLFFYYKTSGLSVSVLVFTLLANYFFGLGIENSVKNRSRKILMACAVILNVLVLAYFKYAYFFPNSFNELFHTNHQVFNAFSYFQNGF